MNNPFVFGLRRTPELLRVRIILRHALGAGVALATIPVQAQATKPADERIAPTASETVALDGTLAYHFTPLSGLSDTVDSVATGHELELVINPTASWRISANVGQQETIVSHVQPGARAAMEALLPVWSQPAFANIPRSTETTLSYLTNLVVVPYRNILSSDGLASAEQRKYRANLVTNYSFRRGWPRPSAPRVRAPGMLPVTATTRTPADPPPPPFARCNAPPPSSNPGTRC